MTELVELESKTTLQLIALQSTFLQFIHVTSEEQHGGEPGQFFCEDTNQCYSKLNAVLLGRYVNRKRYPADKTHGGDLLCWSHDGLKPAEEVAKPGGPLCGLCPFQFERNHKTRTKDCCKKMAKLHLIVQETGLPHYLLCTGTSETEAQFFFARRFLKEKIRQAGVCQTAALLDMDLAFTITSERVGGHVKMVFDNVRLVEDPAEFGPFYQAILEEVCQQCLTA